MAKLLFHGAAGEVTGSMHVLEADGKLIALDCGLFQGRRHEAAAKNQHFPLDPRSLHAVVLSHAHIDHSGRLPMLVKMGFDGPIYSTPATRDLCAVMLADSAHIQEEDARYMNKKRRRDGEPPIHPIYGKEHATAAVALFRAVSYDQPIGVSRSVQARFFDTGHMLGSAGVHLVITEPGRAPVELTFSGDLGRFGTPILRDPADLPACDFLICESTYGARTTTPVTDLGGRLEEIMADALRRGGKVIIPAFSVGRTQSVLYTLNQLMHEGRIPEIPVFIDSPLSVNATEVFRLHPECYDFEATELFRARGDILGSRLCTYVESVDQSKALQKREAPCVIISASGMCESGRILHHLKNTLADNKHTLLIVGYQASHTLGRRLAERQKEVKIFNQMVPVRSRVEILEGFSSHADKNELIRLTGPLAGRCRRAFLVHGEGEQMQTFADNLRIAGFPAVETPSPGDSFELNGRT